MMGLWRDLAPFVRRFRPHWPWMAAGTLLGAAAVAAGIGLLALSGWFLSATAFAGLTAAGALAFNFFHPSVGVRLFAFARIAARYGERVVSHDATFRILETLRTWCYRRLEPLSPGALARYRSGDLLNRLVADIDALDNLYLRLISPTVASVLISVTLWVFLLIFDAAVATVALGILLVATLGVPAVTGRIGMTAGRIQALQTAALRVVTVETLQGLAELLVFDAAGRQMDAVASDNRALVDAQHRMSHISGLAAAAMTLVSGLGVLAVLFIGAGSVHRGALGGVNLACIVLAVWAAFEGAVPLTAAFAHMGRTREAARRVTDIVSTPPEVVYPDAPGTVPCRFDLAFDRVSFRYPGRDTPVLHEVSFDLPQGQRLAVVGETGSGKTTLTHLLVRFADPDAGTVRLGGVPVAGLDEQALRQTVALVSQQAHMFNATLRENLLLARPDADENRMAAALEAAQLADVVAALPDGLDTWIGEAGQRLSGGQARRVAVARAILKDAPVWVLDEPTEGLDTVTEAKLMDALMRCTEGRTVLLITHRLTALHRMDRILVMERGRIIERGTHDDLTIANTRYAALAARLT